MDLILTDPPYGVRARSTSMRKKPLAVARIAGDDGSLDVEACIGLALRTLRSARHLYVFGFHALPSLKLSSASVLIWDKHLISPGDLLLPWAKSWEPIFFSVKGKASAVWRLRRGTVLRVNRVNGSAIKHHLTEKPIALLRELVEVSSRMGETVLDPFAGSGSTLIAAALEGRKAIGIELDERNCEIAARRIEAEA